MRHHVGENPVIGTSDRDVVYGDGFVPFHFSVTMDNAEGDKARFNQLVANVRGLESMLRKHGAGDDFPTGFQQILTTLPGVTAVFVEGPYSSIVIPLCMVRSLGNCPACLSGVLGKGVIADAIRAALQQRGVLFTPHVVPAGDSPLEISIRDHAGNQKAVRLYAASRSAFRHTYRFTDEHASRARGFILSRFNQGRAHALRTVYANEGFTSLRVSEPNRYVKLDDYLSLLPASCHVVVSYRAGVMRKLARHLEIPVRSRHWPQSFDETTENLAHRLTERGDRPRLVALVFEREVALVAHGKPSLRLCPPAEYDSRSRAARVQGACASLALNLPGFQPTGQADWERFGNVAVQAAYDGTFGRPSTYPASTFQPTGTWHSA